MDRLEAMSVVVAVAETGSFSAASRRLRTPVARVSRKVAELETRLRTEVFQRTSRRIALTDAGLSYIAACRRILEQVEDAEQEASGEYTTPKGDLSVTAPWGLGHMHLMPLALQFLETHPEIALRLALTDRVINPIEEDIDVSIRIGPLPDSSMIASHIGSVRLVTCASPSYLAAYGTPMTPNDLGNHQLRRDRGEYWPLPSVEEALAYPYTDAERAAIARNRPRLFVGSPATVMAKLEPMIRTSQADELMVITAVYDHEARKKSYSLLAEAFGLTKRAVI